MFEFGVPPSRSWGLDDPSMIAMENVVWQGILDVYHADGDFAPFIKRISSGFKTIMTIEAPPAIPRLPPASITTVDDEEQPPKRSPVDQEIRSREEALALREKNLLAKEAELDNARKSLRERRQRSRELSTDEEADLYDYWPDDEHLKPAKNPSSRRRRSPSSKHFTAREEKLKVAVYRDVITRLVTRSSSVGRETPALPVVNEGLSAADLALFIDRLVQEHPATAVNDTASVTSPVVSPKQNKTTSDLDLADLPLLEGDAAPMDKSGKS